LRSGRLPDDAGYRAWLGIDLPCGLLHLQVHITDMAFKIFASGAYDGNGIIRRGFQYLDALIQRLAGLLHTVLNNGHGVFRRRPHCPSLLLDNFACPVAAFLYDRNNFNRRTPQGPDLLINGLTDLFDAGSDRCNRNVGRCLEIVNLVFNGFARPPGPVLKGRNGFSRQPSQGLDMLANNFANLICAIADRRYHLKG